MLWYLKYNATYNFVRFVNLFDAFWCFYYQFLRPLSCTYGSAFSKGGIINNFKYAYKEGADIFSRDDGSHSKQKPIYSCLI